MQAYDAALFKCIIYMFMQITKEDHTFQDIMKCYRTQPQANSHVSICGILLSKPVTS